MKQTDKSTLSIQQILQAGLRCFSQAGYKGTSMKDIAQEAQVSIGRVYHHFQAKIDIFTALLEQYWSFLGDPNTELNLLIQRAQFPDDIAALARAIRQVVEENRDHIMLIYVDVIEFHGEHINRIYRNMAENFRHAYADRIQELDQQKRLRPEADPLFAVMFTYRFFFHYFLVETSFGVQDHFGFGTDQVIEKAEDLILHGLLNRGTK